MARLHVTGSHLATGAAVLVAVSLLDGCRSAADKASPEPTALWSGWTYSWELLCHRLSLATVVQQPDGTVDLGLIGGDWSTGDVATDLPQYRLRCEEVRSADFAIATGQTEVITDPDGLLSVTESIDAPEVAALLDQVVLLRGFSIDTDVPQGDDYPDDYDPYLGYESRGFGFSVGSPTVSGDTVSFDVNGQVRWGGADPDDPGGRQDMTNAVNYAHTGVTVAWTVIGFDGSLDTASVTSSIDYEHDPPNSVQPPLTLPVDLDPAAPGLSGLLSFDLAVDVVGATSTDPPQGEYLRSFGAELLTGEDGALAVQTEATNSSVIETAPIRFTPTIEVGWVRLADPDATVTSRKAEGTHDVGTSTATVCLGE